MSAIPETLVGRERESARLVELLRQATVVTVTGPGGVGKTALAAQAARDLESEFADGVRWCDLGPNEAGSSIALTLAVALGGSDVAREEAEMEIPELLAGRDLLIVLDNCEHVGESTASIVSRIGPSARVIATSRRSLGVPGEHVLALEPLPVPRGDDLEAVRASASARLFERRAMASRSDFELTAGNCSDVARLCGRLDGLPLAIELAAARARSLSPREIADRIDERFSLLTPRQSQAGARHGSLRATVDWSYGLLTDHERSMFDRLGVFSSGVGIAAIEVICADATIPRSAVIDLIDGLVDRSLVVARDAHGSMRYTMLSTLRDYARERLVARGELDALRTAHADHFAQVADVSRVEELTEWEPEMIIRLSELEEFLGGVRWCLESDRTPQRAFRLLAPLWAVVHSRAAAEVTELAERALERWKGTDDRLLPTVHGVAAAGQFVLGRPDQAMMCARKGIASASGESSALIARRALALVSYYYGDDLADADRLLEEVVAEADARGAIFIAVEMSGLRALVLAGQERTEAAITLAEDARDRAEGGSNPYMSSWTTYVLGMIELGREDEEAASACLERSLELAQAIDYILVIGGSQRVLGVKAALAGDLPRAGGLLRSSLEQFREIGDRVQILETLRCVAIALASNGDPDGAEQLLNGTEAASIARVVPPLERALIERVMPDRRSRRSALRELSELTRFARERLSSADWTEIPKQTSEPGGDGTAEATFRREGTIWTIAFDGSTVRMPHLKGLADIATLLANAGKDVHCLEMVAGGSGGNADDEAVHGTEGDLGELVDDRARREYRARLADLESEIDESRRHNDPIREERAQDELAAIAEQLEAAYGLGGRPRRTGDPAERARTTVSWRIRSTLAKLDELHAPLARHLRNSIRTGVWCAYAPERPIAWELRAASRAEREPSDSTP